MSMPEYVTVNGTRYAAENLSEAARVQVTNILMVDAELARLQQRLAIAQTARQSYVAALCDAVKAKDVAAVSKPKRARKPKVAVTSEEKA